MSKATAGHLFVKMRVPYLFVPPAGKKTAAEIAKKFATFIDGVTAGYNEQHGTTLSSSEGLEKLLDSNVDPKTLFDEYRGFAEQARGNIINTEWAGREGFDEGYKWMTPEFSQWFIHNVIAHPYKIAENDEYPGRPEFKKILIEHPNGMNFMISFVTALRGFLYPGK